MTDLERAMVIEAEGVLFLAEVRPDLFTFGVDSPRFDSAEYEDALRAVWLADPERCRKLGFRVPVQPAESG